MLTCEVKVNQKTIFEIDIQQIDKLSDTKRSYEYWFRKYTEDGKSNGGTHGFVEHERPEGATKLIKIVLDNVLEISPS